MEEDIFLQWVASDDGLVVHVTIFCLLLLGGIGFPIPEDIPIILGGVAGARGVVNIRLMWLTCYGGVMAADQAVYWLGYFFGGRLLDAGTKSKFFPAITEKRVDEVREGLRKRRLSIIFIGRHLFPVRSVTFLTAGALRVPYLEFLLADGLAALVSVTVVLWLGWYLGGKLTPEMISHIINQVHYYVFGLVVVLVALWLWQRKRQRRNLEAEANSSDTTEQPLEQEAR